MDDNKIIDLLFERSEQGIAELSIKYGKVCKQIANNILNNHRDSEECVNDAYLGMWNSIPPEHPTHLSAYLYKTVRNIALTKYHANTAQKRNSNYDIALSELSEYIPYHFTMEDELSRKELSKLLNDFLGKLPEESRIIFVRRYWYSDSVNNIAEIMNMTPNGISLRLLRIKKKLKKYLTKEGYTL